jgi:hypothetical protein
MENTAPVMTERRDRRPGRASPFTGSRRGRAGSTRRSAPSADRGRQRRNTASSDRRRTGRSSSSWRVDSSRSSRCSCGSGDARSACRWVSRPGLALSRSGVDPVVIGLAIGLVTFAARAGRRTSSGPLSTSASSASNQAGARPGRPESGSRRRSPPNEHLQQLLHPGRATRSCPCSDLRTPAPASTAASSRWRSHRRSCSGS